MLSAVCQVIRPMTRGPMSMLVVVLMVSGPEAFGQSDAETPTAGFRRLTGQHLTLITDLPSAEAVDELPAVFDQAVPQWCGILGSPFRKRPIGTSADI